LQGPALMHWLFEPLPGLLTHKLHRFMSWADGQGDCGWAGGGCTSPRLLPIALRQGHRNSKGKENLSSSSHLG